MEPRLLDALESKNAHEFPRLVLMFAGLAFASILISVYNRYLRQMLSFRWCQWLTTRYLREWLGGSTFYRIERDRLIDDPDQRIAVDLDLFATTTLSLTFDLFLGARDARLVLRHPLEHGGHTRRNDQSHAPPDSGIHALGSHGVCDCRLAPDK
jgi:hypothetical protein